MNSHSFPSSHSQSRSSAVLVVLPPLKSFVCVTIILATALSVPHFLSFLRAFCLFSALWVIDIRSSAQNHPIITFLLKSQSAYYSYHYLYVLISHICRSSFITEQKIRLEDSIAIGCRNDQKSNVIAEWLPKKNEKDRRMKMESLNLSRQKRKSNLLGIPVCQFIAFDH